MIRHKAESTDGRKVSRNSATRIYPWVVIFDRKPIRWSYDGPVNLDGPNVTDSKWSSREDLARKEADKLRQYAHIVNVEVIAVQSIKVPESPKCDFCARPLVRTKRGFGCYHGRDGGVSR